MSDGFLGFGGKTDRSVSNKIRAEENAKLELAQKELDKENDRKIRRTMMGTAALQGRQGSVLTTGSAPTVNMMPSPFPFIQG